MLRIRQSGGSDCFCRGSAFVAERCFRGLHDVCLEALPKTRAAKTALRLRISFEAVSENLRKAPSISEIILSVGVFIKKKTMEADPLYVWQPRVSGDFRRLTGGGSIKGIAGMFC